MIEDLTDYDEVKPGDCITTGLIDYGKITADKIDSSVLIDGSKIACSEINHIYTIYTDRNGKEWLIKDPFDGPPFMVAKEEEK